MESFGICIREVGYRTVDMADNLAWNEKRRHVGMEPFRPREMDMDDRESDFVTAHGRAGAPSENAVSTRERLLVAFEHNLDDSSPRFLIVDSWCQRWL